MGLDERDSMLPEKNGSLHVTHGLGFRFLPTSRVDDDDVAPISGFTEKASWVDQCLAPMGKYLEKLDPHVEKIVIGMIIAAMGAQAWNVFQDEQTDDSHGNLLQEDTSASSSQ